MDVTCFNSVIVVSFSRHFPDDLARLRCRAVRGHSTAPRPAAYTFLGLFGGFPGADGAAAARSEGGWKPEKAERDLVFRAGRAEPAGMNGAAAAWGGRPDHPEGTMAASNRRNRWICSRMAANSFRGMATSAIWKIT